MTALSQISSAEDPSKTVLVLSLSISRPMSPAVCHFWNRDNSMSMITLDSFFHPHIHAAFVSNRCLAIYFDQKSRAWNEEDFEALTDSLADVLPERVLTYLKCVLMHHFGILLIFFGRADEVDAALRAAHEWPETV